MKPLLLLMLTLGFFSGTAHAHNGMVHVMGTVTSVTSTSISVKSTNGTVQIVALTGETKYLRGDSSMTLKDIKVGDHIVVHATGKPDRLIAAEVRAGAMKMSSMKMGPGAQPATH